MAEPPYFQFLDQGHPDDYRSEHIALLIRAIYARENRLLLGLPGCGISNLLRFLVSKPGLVKRHVTFAYVDCAELDPKELQPAFFEGIARQLIEQGLGTPSMLDIAGYERLAQLVLRTGGDPFNRIAVVINGGYVLPDTVDTLFYRRLKALSDHNKRVCFIVGAFTHIGARVDPQNLLFAGHRIAIGPLNERDCRAAIMEEAERLGRLINETQKEQLAQLTGGYPSLLRAVCSAVDELMLDLSLREANSVDMLLSHEAVKAKCAEIWHALEPDHQQALRSIFLEGSTRVDRQDIQWLKTYGMVREHEGSYSLFSPIFEAFVNSEASPDAPTRPNSMELEAVLIENGKVYKGGREVRVSNKEYRLIACLMRERRVYSKNEIIEFVWDEDERRAGVSDETLSNVIARVRRRFGNAYIKTHFGRGFEFLG